MRARFFSNFFVRLTLFYLLRFTSTSSLLSLSSSPLLKIYRKYKYPSSINTQIRRYATHHEISQESQDTAKSDFPFFSRKWGVSETSFDCATRAHPFTTGVGMGGRVKNLQAVRTLSRPPTLDMNKDGEFIYCFMCAHTAWETKHKANKHTCFENEFLTSSFFLRIRKDERGTKEEYATAHRHARQNRREHGHKKASRGRWHPTSEPTQIKAHH